MTEPGTTPANDNGGHDGGEPVILRNPAEAVQITAPTRPDGQPWRFEMIYAGGSRRAYAQTPAALVEALIPGYRGLSTPTKTAEARLRHACDTQVRLQAALVADADLNACSEQQRSLLLGNFSTPPTPQSWDAAIPLVLVSSFYSPIGRIPAPVGENIVWLDPSHDWELLVSLANAGVILLAEATRNTDDDVAPLGEGSDGRG